MRDRPLIVNATAIGHRVDGIAVYGVNLVKSLWRAGVERPLTTILNEDARRFFPDSEIPAGTSIQWVSARMSPSRGTAGNVRRWLFANRLASRHPDAVILGLSQLEGTIAGARTVLMVHDMIPLLFPEAHPRQYYFYRHYLGRALKRAAAVVTPSRTTKDDVCRHYGIDPGRVHVIPHGSPVPMSASAAVNTRRSPYVLWIGRSDPTKNLKAVLTAFRTIRSQIDVRLVLAGEGQLTDPAVAVVDSGSREPTVLGAITEAKKIALLDEASALLSPSLYEGFGFAPLEAMARSCPVIASQAGALPEVCGDAAIYVDPRRPDEIAEAVLRVLANPDLSREMAARGRARCSAMTWEASVRAHLAVIDRVALLDRAEQPAPAASPDPVEADVVP
jgi:glycosyltransferase involved in cell wall biosynthesis